MSLRPLIDPPNDPLVLPCHIVPHPGHTLKFRVSTQGRSTFTVGFRDMGADRKPQSAGGEDGGAHGLRAGPRPLAPGRSLTVRGDSLHGGLGLSRQGFCPDTFTREIRVGICPDYFTSDFNWTSDFTI
jgi:hypothetical protein